MNLKQKIAPPMTEPLDVTTFEGLEQEIATLRKDAADTPGPGPDTYGKKGGAVDLRPSHDLPPGSQDDQALPEDPINPMHYRKHPSGVECIDIARHMNFNIGNAIKYLWRYLDKGDPVENLKKAQWYIEDEIIRLRGK